VEPERPTARVDYGAGLALIGYSVGSILLLLGAVSFGLQLVAMPVGLGLILVSALRKRPSFALASLGASLGISIASYLSYTFGLAPTIFQPNAVLLLGCMGLLGLLGYSVGRALEAPGPSGMDRPDLFMGVAIGLLLLGVFAIFSFGIYFIFMSLTMLSVAWAWSSRPWVVSGAVAGAVTAVIVHFVTAPLRCTAFATAGPGVTSEGSFCSRIALPDVQGVETTGAHILALALALGLGALAAFFVGRAAKRKRVASAA
jgi:hypothetical protein